MRSEVAERLQRADGFIGVAGDLLRLGHWSDGVSRSYYAMFHAAGDFVAACESLLARREHG